jgi:uncharacterized membrane protein YhaH (DUF805 family)
VGGAEALIDGKVWRFMTLSEPVKMSLARYASFGGRARRSEYWYFTLVHLLVILLAMVVSYLAMLANPALAIILYSIVFYGTLSTHLALSVRRLHDVNRSGWWYLLGIVPLLGALVLLVWFCTDGTRGPNRFGADPKASEIVAGAPKGAI